MAGRVFYDRVKDTSSTTGTGTLTISGTPPTGSQPFSLVGTNLCDFVAYSADNSQWEVQASQSYSSNTLTRGTPVASSNSGALVNFTLPITVELAASSNVFTQFQKAAFGFQGINSQTSNYTLALSDMGGIVVLPSGASAGITVTVPPHGTVAWPTDRAPTILIVNQNATYTISIAQGSGVTLTRRDGISGTGTRTVGVNSEAELKYYGALSVDNWDISGSALS